MVLVPDVQGRHWEEARGELETAGLRFELEEEPEATEPEGTIVRLDPGPGESVPTGSQVRLYIAGPPEMVEMPGVVDVPVEMARNWLEEARLQVIEEPIWSTRPISTVLAQEPERGTRVQAGSVVTLTISGGTDAPIEINATLGNAIVLEKAELRQALLSPGDVLIVSLRWRPLTTIDTRYVVFVHLISPAGDLVAQEDVEPLRGNQPTNTWTEEIPLWDRHQVQVPASAPAGTYEVRTGMYPLGRPGDRLSVVDPGEASVETDSILVAEVEVRRR
jgi:hypothetical protein